MNDDKIEMPKEAEKWLRAGLVRAGVNLIAGVLVAHSAISAEHAKTFTPLVIEFISAVIIFGFALWQSRHEKRSCGRELARTRARLAKRDEPETPQPGRAHKSRVKRVNRDRA